MIIFNNDPVDLVLKGLSRWYNIDFEIDDQKLNEFTYTATFIDETLAQVLELMELAAPIETKMALREKLPDGSFTKGKIIVQMKE